jgi:quercetin dioxygenase-like cupin family protein
MHSIINVKKRKFVADEHIRDLLAGEWINLVDEAGQPLVGIRGRMGVAAATMEGLEMGADLIEMQPGSAFALHVHPGEHILFVIEGKGLVHVDGVDHQVKKGETIFVPAEYPHGVKTYPDASEPLQLLAVGYPHKRLDAKDRMRVVEEES